MTGITIRSADASDIGFIREQYVFVEEYGAPHWRHDGRSPYTDTWIEHVIENAPEDQAIFVATVLNGTRLGYTWVLTLLEFDTIVPHGHIAGVGVAEAARGRGVGSLLVSAAESWCREQQLAEVTLHCYVANEGAHRLYERLGFEDEWYHMRKGL
jgi:dTDP-4-amino-4,6-dideoxy-D-galactose acyltransferase